VSEPEKTARLKINGKEYEQLTDFTVGELRTLKRFTGKSLDEMDWSDAEAIAAACLVILRREDPTFSEEQLDDVRVEIIEGEADASPPVNGADPETPPEISGAPS
jgi:hypothetical protein